MRTLTVTFEGRETVVGARIIRTAITEQEIWAALRQAYPCLLERDKALLSVDFPAVVNPKGKTNGEMFGVEAYTAYLKEKDRVLHPVHDAGEAHNAQMTVFVPLLARVVKTGEAFANADGKPDISKAYEDYVAQDTAPGGVWACVAAAIAELDRPTAPLDMQSPEMVGDLATNPTGGGSTANGKRK